MKQLYIYFLLLIFVMASTMAGHALPAEAYTDTSVLATGRWVKISVPSDGLYLLSNDQLKRMGFTDPSRVTVRGYGGHRLPDLLSKNTYVDDLPQINTELTDRGLLFYGLGGGQWVSLQTNYRYWRPNDYSSVGYYFVGELAEGEERRAFETSAKPDDAPEAMTFIDCVQHEQEIVAIPGEAGPVLLGEEFKYTPTRKFRLAVPGAVPSGHAYVALSFVTDFTGTATLQLKAGSELVDMGKNSRLLPTVKGNYSHGIENAIRTGFILSDPVDEQIEFTLSLSHTGVLNGAWLNYLALNYERELKLPDEGYLIFNVPHQRVGLGGERLSQVWDVSNPANIKKVDYTTASNGLAGWRYTYFGDRRYAAFRDDARFNEPTVCGTVTAQNLHGHRDFDMVIVSPAAYLSQAERLADFHRNSADSMKVAVVSPEEIYNEFSSGTLDVGGIRRYFKMLYDRGNESGRPLRYAVLIGRVTIDNRGISNLAPSYPTVPAWMPESVTSSLSDILGFCTDDYMAMLDDGSGSDPRNDKLSIAIGRLPVVSDTEAGEVVDKIIQYGTRSKKSAWKHRFMFLADDQDNAIHLNQTESMISKIENNGNTQPYLLRKLYMDAYEYSGKEYPQCRADMFRQLDEGVVWWNYIGHANTTGWTAEKQLIYSDINSMYLRHLPFIYAATCNFLRLDGNFISGGELLFKERYGGAIGVISAVRPVYITDNGLLSDAVGRALTQRDDKGQLLTPGEVYRRAKNDIRSASTDHPVGDDNRLRYVFVGDPALPLAMPSNLVRVDSIKGEALTPDGQPVMAALERVPVSGSVTDPEGTVLEDFNGAVMVEIFDAERTITTKGNGADGVVKNFEDYGSRIYCGSTTVRNGRFNISIAMPMEIAQNFRPAAMSLYAYSDSDDTEAVGLNRDFYVYGYDESEAPDLNAPVIESLVLNHQSFVDGGMVNTDPLLIAMLRDDVGLNVSSAGVGHQMTAILDGRYTYSDVSNYFTPSADGSPSGVINYPFEGLTPGTHSLELRVWDTSGNAAVETINFFVAEGLAPKIYDVYSDANPASTQANFYLVHDQPDRMVTVGITVYNLLGRPVWSKVQSGRSDMFTTVPVTWDLRDTGGHRVDRGIYLYRATITADGETYETASRRIAVTAR